MNKLMLILLFVFFSLLAFFIIISFKGELASLSNDSDLKEFSFLNQKTYKEKCKHYNKRVNAIKRVCYIFSFMPIFIIFNRSHLEIFYIIVIILSFQLVVILHNAFFIILCIFNEKKAIVLLMLTYANVAFAACLKDEIVNGNSLYWLILSFDIIIEGAILIKLYKSSKNINNTSIFDYVFYKNIIRINCLNILLFLVNLVLYKTGNILVDNFIQYLFSKYLMTPKNIIYLFILLTTGGVLYIKIKKKEVKCFILVPIIAITFGYTFLFHSRDNANYISESEDIDRVINTIKYTVVHLDPEYIISFTPSDNGKYENGIDIKIQDSKNVIEEGKFIVSDIRYSYKPKMSIDIKVIDGYCNMIIGNNTIGSLRDVTLKIKTNDKNVNDILNNKIKKNFDLGPGEYFEIMESIDKYNGFEYVYVDNSFSAGKLYYYYAQLNEENNSFFSNNEKRTISASVDKIVIQGEGNWSSNSINLKDMNGSIKFFGLTTKQDAEFNFCFMYRIGNKWYCSDTYYVNNHVSVPYHEIDL